MKNYRSLNAKRNGVINKECLESSRYNLLEELMYDDCESFEVVAFEGKEVLKGQINCSLGITLTILFDFNSFINQENARFGIYKEGESSLEEESNIFQKFLFDRDTSGGIKRSLAYTPSAIEEICINLNYWELCVIDITKKVK